MAKSKFDFVTVPEELLACATAAAQHFGTLGYRVRVEPHQFDYPYAPTLVCKRDRTTLIIEVQGRLDRGRLEDWARYAKSLNKDVRIAVVMPASSSLPVDIENELRDEDLGLYRDRGAALVEVLAPKDLAVNFALPSRDSLHPRIQRALGRAYEQLDHSNWREAFEEICQALETHARDFLKREVASRGPGAFIDAKGKPYSLSVARVDKMTLGQLAIAFAEVSTATHSTSVITRALTRVNGNRVGVVHHKTASKTEQRLRRSVGQDVYTAIAALKILLKVP